MAFLVGACAVRDPYVTAADTISSGNWKIDKTTDKITGSPSPAAELTVENASNSLDEKVRSATLQLSCFENAPLVSFAFEFKIGTDVNSILGYRFDDKPGHDNVPSRILSNHTKIVIEDSAEIARFVSELATSKRLAVRIRSLNGGRTTAEFDLNGAQGAIDAVFPHCPPAAEPPRAGKKSGIKS